MKNKMIKTAVIVAVMAAAGIFFIKSGEGQDISRLREEMKSEAEAQNDEKNKDDAQDRLGNGQLSVKLRDPEDTGVTTETAAVVQISEISAAMEESADTSDVSEEMSTIPESNSEFQVDDGRININTASADELKKLNGIGDAKAQKIIDYRQLHGGFSSIEEITEVNGIGSATFEKIRDSIKI